jgi:hypothetical protein
MPPQHVRTLFKQCFAATPSVFQLRTHFLITVPERALQSAAFCFSAALKREAQRAYAVSDAACVTLTMLFDEANTALLPDKLSSAPYFTSLLTSSSPSPSSPSSPPPPPIIQPYPLPPSLRRACYFSHYDSSGSIAPHTLHLIDSILLLGFHMVLISCSPSLTPLAQRQLQLRGVTYALYALPLPPSLPSNSPLPSPISAFSLVTPARLQLHRAREYRQGLRQLGRWLQRVPVSA